MLRTIILLSILLVGLVFKSHAQLEFSANPEYGQIYDIVYHGTQEDVIYARTVGNHILKSIDDGQHWEILYSDPMDIYCTLSGMRLINNGDNLSFIVKAEGTAYNKVVLINSEDGRVEKTFNVPNPQQADVLIASYDIFEANNDIAVLHTTYSMNWSFTNEVFLTTDGGLTWESIYNSPDYLDVSINNVAIAPDNSDKIFLMRGMSPGSDFGGLYVSMDAGSTWEEKIPGNTYSAIAFNPTNAQDIFLGTFYGYGSHQENLYRSLDGGESWNIVPITWTSMSSDHINQITFNPSNADNIIVLEENEIAITNDNGATWHNEVYTEIDPEQYFYGLSVSFNPYTADEVIVGTDFYPFKSVDGGVTLEKLENAFVNSTGRIDSYTSPSENHLYYGLRNGFMHRNMANGDEAGFRMRSLNNTFGATTFPFADKEVSGRIFNSSRFGMNSVVEMSLDHGENYVALYSTMDFLNIYEMATAPSNTNVVWFSFGDSMYRIDVADPNAPIVGQVNLPSFELCYGLIIDPADEDHIVVSLGTKIYSTTDAGFSWENSSAGLESLVEGEDIITDLAINPFNPDEYVLASTNGIFISLDAGASWSRVFDGFVEKVDFSTETNGHLVATNLFSDGYLFPQSTTRIIFSTNKGETWEVISGEALEYLNASSSTVHFFQESADVYFGTFDTGLVKYNIDLLELGTEDIAPSSGISLFPNPAMDYITISSTHNPIQKVTIYSVTGQKVFEVIDGFQSINISWLSPGIHLVKLELENSTTFTRLVKQ
jgi:photosystem II stability/assembly factor-like uncharacterized protein